MRMEGRGAPNGWMEGMNIGGGGGGEGAGDKTLCAAGVVDGVGWIYLFLPFL